MGRDGALAAISLAGPSQDLGVHFGFLLYALHECAPRFCHTKIVFVIRRFIELLTCIGDTLHAGAGTYWGAQPRPQHQVGIEGKGGEGLHLPVVEVNTLLMSVQVAVSV